MRDRKILPTMCCAIADAPCRHFEKAPFRRTRMRYLAGTALVAGLAATAAAHAAPMTAADLMQGMLGSPKTNAGGPTPAAVKDLGAVAADTIVPLTVYLKPSDAAGLAAFVCAAQDPTNPSFHHFITRPVFAQRFAATAATIMTVENVLRSKGFSIDRLLENHLAIRISGTVATIDATFGLTLHQYGSGASIGYASTTPPVFPAAIAAFVEGLGGFETIIPSTPGPDASNQINPTGVTLALSGAAFSADFKTATGVNDAPGALTPGDFEKIYDLTPLVTGGATGAGETIAIVTEQNFTKSNAETFWTKVHVHRTGTFDIRHVEDTQAETPGTTTESDLDTEQAGTIAPAATLIAYVTPHGPAGLLDGYEHAASENQADVVSSSFGTPELYFSPNGTELYNATLLPAFKDVFSELAAQGQTVFAAAGDGAAFDINRNEQGYYEIFPTVGGSPAYTPVYSVNAIAASPLVTAAGGTTLPITGVDQSVTPAFTVTIPAERAWSSSYVPLAALEQSVPLASVEALFEIAFPTGGSGGVSTIWPVPAYQKSLAGIATSQPGQALVQLGGTPTVLATLPANYAGRNLPDLSANSDGHSGYEIYTAGKMEFNGGGTSFVAPQFAGTLALIDQALGHRVGQLNPLLYRLQASGAAPARDILAGDNWGYAAHAGYDQATGLGAMDGARLFWGLKSFDK